nr:immunoglobulin light chain junction region [Macaca mulatta]MOW09563.1 immunoglobulin light chain junction region [Macaca mulatta]
CIQGLEFPIYSF